MVVGLKESLGCSLSQRSVAIFPEALFRSWGKCLAEVAEDQAMCIGQCEFLGLFTEIKRHYSMGRDVGVERLVIDPRNGNRLRLAKSLSEFWD